MEAVISGGSHCFFKKNKYFVRFRPVDLFFYQRDLVNAGEKGVNAVDTEQLQQIITTYSDMLYRIALVQTGSREEAGDMMQQTFLQLLEHQDRLRDPEHVKAWLIRVCINQCRNHRTTAWKRRVLLTGDRELPWTEGAAEGSEGDPVRYRIHGEESPQEQQLLAQQESQALWQSIRNLPEKYRMVLHLAYQEEYSVREIARILQISPGNVSVRLNRAKKQLAKQLEKEGYRYETY